MRDANLAQKLEMSGWDDLVQRLVDTNHVSEGGYFGLDGDAWATSPGFDVIPPEVQAIVSALKGKPDDLRASGVVLNGHKYMVVAFGADGDLVSFKRPSQVGGTAVLHKNGVVIGMHTEDMEPSQCWSAVVELAEYLNSQNS